MGALLLDRRKHLGVVDKGETANRCHSWPEMVSPARAVVVVVGGTHHTIVVEEQVGPGLSSSVTPMT